MPLPTEFEGKVLIGTRWRRRLGKHRGTEVTIVQHNDAGVKIEINTRTAPGGRRHLGQKRYGSLQWPMFTNLYEPEGILSDMLITTDKEGFVQRVEKEGTVNKPIPEEMKSCNGPWHYKQGHGTPVPVSHFRIATRGPNKGLLSATCNECKERRKRWAVEQNYKKPSSNGRVSLKEVQTVVEEKPIPVEAPVVTIEPASRYRWRVTLIPLPKPTTVEVEADDFLSAGIAAGEGEILRVERI